MWIVPEIISSIIGIIIGIIVFIITFAKRKNIEAVSEGELAMHSHNYDIIIAGSGLAALSLQLG